MLDSQKSIRNLFIRVENYKAAIFNRQPTERLKNMSDENSEKKQTLLLT